MASSLILDYKSVQLDQKRLNKIFRLGIIYWKIIREFRSAINQVTLTISDLRNCRIHLRHLCWRQPVAQGWFITENLAINFRWKNSLQKFTTQNFVCTPKHSQLNTTVLFFSSSVGGMLLKNRKELVRNGEYMFSVYVWATHSIVNEMPCSHWQNALICLLCRSDLLWS